MQLKERVKYVMENEDGYSNVEMVVWISVILIIIGFFILFHDNIINFIKKGFNVMDRKHSGSQFIRGD